MSPTMTADPFANADPLDGRSLPAAGAVIRVAAQKGTRPALAQFAAGPASQARGRVSPEAMTAAVDPLAAENPARLVRFILGMVERDRGKAKQPAGRAG